MPKRIAKEDFSEEVLLAGLPVIAEFYSDSCIACRQMAATLADLEEEYDRRIKIVKVNINYSPELTSQYTVRSAPTLLFFKDKHEIKRISGVIKKADLQVLIESIL